MLNFLVGHKTYILAAIGAIITFAYSLGWIDTTVYQVLIGLVGSGGLATLRSAVATVEKDVKHVDTGVAIVEKRVAQVDADVATVDRKVEVVEKKVEANAP
jgi:hypothetical protein